MADVIVDAAGHTIDTVIICRACNTECTTYKPLFKQGIIMEELTTLARLLQFCTSMPVVPEENYLPTHICQDCTQLLAKMYEFKKMVLHTNYTLRKQYSDMNSAKVQKLLPNPVEVDGSADTIIEQITDQPIVERMELKETELCQSEVEHFPEIETQDSRRLEVTESSKHESKAYKPERTQEISIEHEQLEVSIVPAMNPHMLYDGQEYNEHLVTDGDQHQSYITLDNMECEGDIEIESAVEVDESTHDYEMIQIDTEDIVESDQYDDGEYSELVEWSQHNGESRESAEFTLPVDGEHEESPKSRNRFKAINKQTNPKFKCTVCGKQLSNNNSYKYHMQLHSDLKPYLCSLCGELFKTRNAYDGHITIHDPDNPNKCIHCGKCYRQASSLRAHLLVHTGERPYVCEICGKGMTQKSGYKKHMLTHTGEKPHTCDICRRSFRYSSNLIAHRRCHSRDRPFSCKDCTKSFNSSSQLNQHKVVHNVEKAYPCDKCNKSFKRRISLTSHKQTHYDASGDGGDGEAIVAALKSTTTSADAVDIANSQDKTKAKEREHNSNLIQVL